MSKPGDIQTTLRDGAPSLLFYFAVTTHHTDITFLLQGLLHIFLTLFICFITYILRVIFRAKYKPMVTQWIVTLNAVFRGK